MSAILLDGGIVHYEVIGRGRPIIFLHGWVGSWRYWVPAMQTASTSFRAYAVDLWGFGDTARDPARYTIEKQAGLLDAFMQEMGIGKVAIVGHGLGALAGLRFTMSHPTMVDRIMALQVPYDLESVAPKFRNSGFSDLLDWLFGKGLGAEPVRTDAVKADPLAHSTSFNSPDAFNIGSRLNLITIPCLLVYGQTDPAISSPPFSPETAPPLMHALVLEQMGHFPMLDDAARFNRLLTDFLSLASGETPRDLQMKEEWKRRVR
jgi:pimeloyl-ACP methyl ester carboxylesterase